jgi:hypothetical protein
MPDELVQLQEQIGAQSGERDHKKAILERLKQTKDLLPAPGRAPGHIFYDRMKTVVLRKPEREAIQPRRAASAVRLTALSSA